MRTAATLLILSALCAATLLHAGEESIQLTDGKGRDMASASCVTCHSLDYIPMNAPAMSRAAWQKTVRKMVDKFGAPIREEDVPHIVDYLAEHYSAPGSP